MQFFLFLAIAGCFFFLNFLVSSYFFSDIAAIALNKNAVVSPELVTKFKFAQLASATITFILPALLFGYRSSPKALPYLGIQKSISVTIFLCAVVLLFVIQPFVGWLGELNSHLSFGSLSNAIKDAEAMYDRLLKLFLKMDRPSDLFINLLVMALLPAIGEELFFRGALQKTLSRLTHRAGLAIVITSLVFALLHGTYLKIIPIFALGLMLGVVYHVTRNLWYTVIIHFINNAFAVLAVYYADRSATLKRLADSNFTVTTAMAIISLTIGIGIIFLMKKKSDEVLPKVVTKEENDFLA